jgi:hypothetical protein
MPLSIRKVDRDIALSIEPLGSKYKFWFREGTQDLLFKADDRETGEDWAEVIACTLCGALGLPHVEYQLAAQYQGEQFLTPGVVCPNMAPKPKILYLGNQLLFALDDDYPQERKFKVRQHTVEAVVGLLTVLHPPAEEWPRVSPTPPLDGALDHFAGYMMLDAWIANQDRHHENWAGIWDRNAMRLAPTFDHGAGLGRNLEDAQRVRRLQTKDRNYSVEAFAAKGRSAFFAARDNDQPLLLVDCFHAFADHCPRAKAFWLERLASVTEETIRSAIEEIPESRMSPVCKEFTFQLLRTNKQRLLA